MQVTCLLHVQRKQLRSWGNSQGTLKTQLSLRTRPIHSCSDPMQLFLLLAAVSTGHFAFNGQMIGKPRILNALQHVQPIQWQANQL